MRYRRKQSTPKKTKNVKKQKVHFMPKSIACAHRKYEKVDTHKK